MLFKKTFRGKGHHPPSSLRASARVRRSWAGTPASSSTRRHTWAQDHKVVTLHPSSDSSIPVLTADRFRVVLHCKMDGCWWTCAWQLRISTHNDTRLHRHHHECCERTTVAASQRLLQLRAPLFSAGVHGECGGRAFGRISARMSPSGMAESGWGCQAHRARF